MRLSTISKIIIVIIITLAITIIILYNYYHIDPAIFGPIGDSIGGTLTPFLSLITIIFIYETFLVEKSKSNLEKERHEAELLNNRIERIHDSIDNFYHVSISKPFGDPTFSEMINPTKEYYKSETLRGTIAILNYYDGFMKDYKDQQTLLTPKDMELQSIYLYFLNLLQNVEKFEPEQFFLQGRDHFKY
ncbi:MAG: hypothetical protein IPH42_03650 [Bacteroidetes bacterium]|nr:hypothetical protein [Bacteroidota bacterium]MBP9189629.1 hypothetical protein [Chitinophagales bacterium]